MFDVVDACDVFITPSSLRVLIPFVQIPMQFPCTKFFVKLLKK